jgi:hypothetical protein
MARNLLKAWPALWTIAKHPGIEPTNNHAERALRGAAIHRKLSLGSQSNGGEQRTARLLPAHTTCRLQHRSIFYYLANAIAAHARGHPAPLLTETPRTERLPHLGASGCTPNPSRRGLRRSAREQIASSLLPNMASTPREDFERIVRDSGQRRARFYANSKRR